MSVSLRKKLVIGFVVLIGILVIAFLSINFLNSRSSNTKLLSKSEDEINALATNISAKYSNNIKAIEEFSKNRDLTSEDLSLEKKLKLIDDFKNKNGYDSGKLIDTEGDCITSNMKIVKVDKEEPFINAMKGISTTSKPRVNKGTGSVTIGYTVPIIRDSKVIGALSFSKIVMNIS